MPATPVIAITVADPSAQAEPEIAQRKNDLYVEAIRRHGGEPVVLDARASADERRSAFESMAGLLLTGGADIDPARYGKPNQGSVSIEPARDALELEAYTAAAARGIPILGICRGFQAINVFRGGPLLQHVDGHVGAGWGHGPAKEHALRLVPGSRLARILSPTNPRAGATTVNSYHHQAVRATDLAKGLVASAWAASPEGDLVEGFEAAEGPFLLGVQCHPERTDSTPDSFERLWRFFVDACRGPISAR
ncbi:MAG TPA: gamma-glutamyl-gamma-aminobutyrate hydrolase family protein [Candidatus Limnocylindrales bacterium]